MTPDQASQIYNGPIPDKIRRTFLYKSPDEYHRIFLITAEQNFLQRFRDILRSLCVWRQYAAYPEDIKNKMLLNLSNALFQARLSVIKTRGFLGG